MGYGHIWPVACHRALFLPKSQVQACQRDRQLEGSEAESECTAETAGDEPTNSKEQK